MSERSSPALASVALNRFGIGARRDEPVPGDSARWLLDQLDRFDPAAPAFARLPDPGEAVAAYLEYARRVAAGQAAPDDGDAARKDERREFAQDLQAIYRGGVNARVETALTSAAPFLERMVWFWSNHFAVSVEKAQVAGFAPDFEAKAIRPHVLGRFADLLIAVERHPAMLLYLDQASSIGPNSPLSQRVEARGAARAPGLNENLAREILELHTLGVRTGYSQADVTELARALTGWTVAGLGRGGRAAALTAGKAGAFLFVPALHEPGARTVLGKRYGQGGEAQARAVLEDLAARPETARHLAAKLARHFAGDEPPAALVARLEAAWLKSGGDLATVYRALIEAPEPWVGQPVKFKTPWEWTVSAMRALGARAVERAQFAPALAQLGQPVWKPGSPAGFDDTTAAWAGPDALVRRVELAQRLVAPFGDRIEPRALAAAVLPGQDLGDVAVEIGRAESVQTGLALLLVSPPFLRR